MKNKTLTQLPSLFALFLLIILNSSLAYASGAMDFNDNLNVTINVTEASCDSSDGEIEVMVSGGQPPYTIMPSNLMNLASGTYSITISDSGSCVLDTSITVGEMNDLSTFVDVLDDIDCAGNETAEAIINIAGGSGDYLVMIDENPPISEISPGIFSTTVSGGTYGITITDTQDNCMLVDNFAVGQPSPIEITAEITEIDSCAGTILNLDVTASGGTPPYDIEFNPDNAGVEIVVTDDTDCQASLYVENPPIENALEIIQILVFDTDPGEEDGEIDITVEGGEPPYFFEWQDADGNTLSTDEDIDDLPAGTYIVFVSDSDGCSISSGDIEVEMTTAVVEHNNYRYGVYPNPVNGNQLFINGPITEAVHYSIYSSSGQTLFTGRLTNTINTVDLQKMEAGMYYMKFINEAGESELHLFIKL